MVSSHISLERLNRAISQFDPIEVFGLFSGGHDSFCASYIATQHPRCSGIVHINTGIGIKATHDYVIETCQKRGWKLIEYKAAENVNANGEPDPQNYDDIVREHGFPGPGGHQFMYIRLKERALARLCRDFGADCRGKEKRRVMLVSGARQQESERRMGNTEELQIDGRRIWVAPIIDWSKSDTARFLEEVSQPRNIVVDLIHKIGECLCGAFAKRGELEELKMWPQTQTAYNRIKTLELEVKPIHGWGWGEKPLPAWYKQQAMLPLCWSCVNGSPVPSADSTPVLSGEKEKSAAALPTKEEE